MNARFSLTAPVLVATLLSLGVQAEGPPPLVHNPFSRPPSAVLPDALPVFSADGSEQPLDLRATMVAGADRLANVAGRTLRPGDEVQGYKLLQVLEDRAVFSREGQRVTVHVKPHLVDDNE